jgi:hypothetical protein
VEELVVAPAAVIACDDASAILLAGAQNAVKVLAAAKDAQLRVIVNKLG